MMDLAKELINLNKGNEVKLEKNGLLLKNICIGLNWGAMPRKSKLLTCLFGGKTVDLDASVAVFSNGKCIDRIYYKRLVSSDGAITHTGDDLSGDKFGDDGVDNEMICVNLNKITNRADSIVFLLNSYSKHAFSDIPYSNIRIYEGNPKNVTNTLATFNLSTDKNYEGYVSIVMAKLIKESNGSWIFKAIGEGINTEGLNATLNSIKQQYI
jgi:tellurium resistance protein TerZ